MRRHPNMHLPRTRVVPLLCCGAVLATAIGASQGCSKSTPSNDVAPEGLAQLEQDTGVRWVAISNNTFGTTSYLFPRTTPPVALAPGSDATSVAAAFFARYGGVFGMVDPIHELSPESSGTSEGLRFASFIQHEGAAAVYGTRLSIVFDAGGHIAFVSGLYVPKLSAVSTTPSLSPTDAASKATADMATRYPVSDLASQLAGPAPALVIYPFVASPTLAYSLTLGYTSEPSGGKDAPVSAEMDYVVDANSGALLDASDASRYQVAPGTPVVPLTGNGQGEVPGVPPQDFPALETSVKRPPDFFMQTAAGPGVAPRYVRQAIPVSGKDAGIPPSVLTSPDPNSWDRNWNVQRPSLVGTFINAGSAVDAYMNVGKADAWWQAHGRNGYDNHGGATMGLLPAGYLDASLADLVDPADAGFVNAHGQLEIIVHSTARAMANNARWDGINATIMVGESPLLACPSPTYAASMDLEIMAHEYQHAVTQTTVAFIAGGQPGALNESFSDVFAQFIAHGTPGATANCIHGLAWDPSNEMCGHPPGVRNLVDPHQSGFNGPGNPPKQPDNVNDAPLASSTNVHLLDGIPNKAWSLATFGGQDHTAPNLVVSPSLGLGWEKSEDVYVSFIQSRPVAPAAQFIDVAYALTGLASAQFGRNSSGEAAVACAWYAVGVLNRSAMATLDIDPCTCGDAPEAGTCDAGKDAGSEGGNVYNRTYNCLLNLAEGGTAFECITQQQFTAADALTACAIQGSGPFTSNLVASCPAGALLGCCRAGASQTCAYDSIAWDGLKSLCTAENGTLNSSGNAPSSPDAAPPSDGGLDGGTDASADATLPPHC